MLGRLCSNADRLMCKLFSINLGISNLFLSFSPAFISVVVIKFHNQTQVRGGKFLLTHNSSYSPVKTKSSYSPSFHGSQGMISSRWWHHNHGQEQREMEVPMLAYLPTIQLALSTYTVQETNKCTYVGCVPSIQLTLSI